MNKDEPMRGESEIAPNGSPALTHASVSPDLDAGVLEAGPSTPISTAGQIGTARPNREPPQQLLRYVESTSSSSGDEIAPCDDQSTPAPFKKNRHGKFTYSDRYDMSEYVIEQLSEFDDVDMVKPWHRKLIMIHPIVIVWVFLTYAAYYSYRVWVNYQFRLTYGGLDEASWIFICVEGVILC